MPKRCAVPTCDTGRKRDESRHSVFRVPSDIDLWKKWEQAIPGLRKLERTQVVCDKHFEEKYIHREWVKRDSNGQVIAKVRYKCPHLNKVAVPSKFGEPSVENENNNPWHEYAKRTPSGNPVPMEETGADSSSISLCFGNQFHLSTNASVESAAFMKPSMQMVNTLAEEIPEAKNILLIAKPAFDNAPLPLSMDGVHCDLPVADSFTQHKSFKLLPSVTISERIRDESTSTWSEVYAAVPELWSVTELPIENGQRFIFSYLTMKLENSMHCPITEKSVTLDADRMLNYFVYGHHVNQHEMKLDQVLSSIETLPDILIKFKRMNLCSGLGDVNIHLVPAGEAYLDYTDKLRSKECTLVSKKKRCSLCIKSRKCIQKRTARLNNRSMMNRIRDVSNPIDRCKLSAMRNRYRRERRQKLRAKERVKELIANLKNQAEQIASMRDTTLDRRKYDRNDLS